jgi:transcription elongation factor GreA
MGNEAERSGPGSEPITAEGLEALKVEVAELEGPGREAMAERLKNARALGDLKENAEYHIAKEDQAHLETRIRRLRDRLNNAVVVEAGPGESRVFSFGRTAEVVDPNGKRHRWTLVGSTEADMSKGLLSAESPIGVALMGGNVGEELAVETPGGTRTYRIEKVE